jgi:hypothetical protein
MESKWGVAARDRLLSLSDSAEFLGVSVASMRRLVRGQHVVYSVTEGGHYRVRVRDLEKYQEGTSAKWASSRSVRPSKASK